MFTNRNDYIEKLQNTIFSQKHDLVRLEQYEKSILPYSESLNKQLKLLKNDLQQLKNVENQNIAAKGTKLQTSVCSYDTLDSFNIFVEKNVLAELNEVKRLNDSLAVVSDSIKIEKDLAEIKEIFIGVFDWSKPYNDLKDIYRMITE